MSDSPITEILGDISGNPVRLSLGDVSASDADAILVPQFKTCASYGGVGGSIARSGGLAGMEEFDAFAKEKGELGFATVLLTRTADGSAPSLIHGVSVGAPDWGQFTVARSTLLNALLLAGKAGIVSVAAPVLCTGIIGALTDRQAGEAMMSAIAEYAQGGNPPVEVRIVAFRSPQTLTTLSDVLTSGSYAQANQFQVGERPFDVAKWHDAMTADEVANLSAFGAEPSAFGR